MKKIVRALILALCCLGIVLSSVSTYSHYATGASEYCDLNAAFNCDIVNRSSYSEIFGIPVALVGIAGYLLLLALTLFPQHKKLLIARLICSLGGLCFALRLTWVEDHVLHTWCLLCLGSLASILGITLLSGVPVFMPGQRRAIRQR